MRIALTLSAFVALAGSASAGVLSHDNGSVGAVRSFTGPIQMSSGSGLANRGGAVVYDASTQTGFRYTPGQANAAAVPPAPADAARVAYDDVPISNTILNGATSLDVCRVTVGIRQLGGAAASTVDVFWNTFTTTVTAPDTQLDLPSNLIGTATLPAAAASVTTLVSFGTSGGPALFNVPLNSTLISGFGTFGIGVRLSDTSGTTGWRLTSGPSPNANIFWLHDPNLTSQTNPEGAFLFSSASPPNPAATFYIVVEGTPVPTPGAMGLLGLGGLVALRRRR